MFEKKGILRSYLLQYFLYCYCNFLVHYYLLKIFFLSAQSKSEQKFTSGPWSRSKRFSVGLSIYRWLACMFVCQLDFVLGVSFEFWVSFLRAWVWALGRLWALNMQEAGPGQMLGSFAGFLCAFGLGPGMPAKTWSSEIVGMPLWAFEIKLSGKKSPSYVVILYN